MNRRGPELPGGGDAIFRKSTQRPFIEQISVDDCRALFLKPYAGDDPPGPFHSFSGPAIAFKIVTRPFGTCDHIDRIREFLQGPKQVKRFDSAAARDGVETKPVPICLFKGLPFLFTAPGCIPAVENGDLPSCLTGH
jgi:hypothetical protein